MSDLGPLNRPVWNCLNGPQSVLAVASGDAVRLDPRYGPFAAACDAGAAGQRALAALLRDADDLMVLVEPEPWPAPPGTEIAQQSELLQMVAEDAQMPLPEDRSPILLGEGDAGEMAALALATEPGPWGKLTHRYGSYYGFREQGALQAMAGERMRPAPGLAEVSGVCTWPQWQGRGLAGQLIRRVMAGFVARGDTPFLHSYATNSHAIRLYESLGFRARRAMVATFLRKI
jgi:ribosomal protein S18 acetylase RimI-like enzyme